MDIQPNSPPHSVLSESDLAKLTPPAPQSPEVKKEDELLARVSADGAINLFSHLPRHVSQQDMSGEQIVMDARRLDNARTDNGFLRLLHQKFNYLAPSWQTDWRRFLQDKDIYEAVAAFSVTREITETEMVMEKQGRLIKREVPAPRQVKRLVQLQHKDVVQGGKDEPLYMVYYLAQGNPYRRNGVFYSDSYGGGRGGNFLLCGIALPQNLAVEVLAQIRQHPVFARRIVEKMILDRTKITKADWEGTPGKLYRTKPPYEVMDKLPAGPKMYIKGPESDDRFHQEEVYPVIEAKPQSPTPPAPKTTV